MEPHNERETEREFIMNAAIPADLVEALSTAASEGEQAWRSMREENNWQDFKPHLERIFKLSREQVRPWAMHWIKHPMMP